jgi:hypothetical protein
MPGVVVLPQRTDGLVLLPQGQDMNYGFANHKLFTCYSTLTDLTYTIPLNPFTNHHHHRHHHNNNHHNNSHHSLSP